MDLWTEGAVAFLAAVGLTALAWLPAAALSRRRTPALHAVIVLPVQDEGAQMDYALYTACRLRCRLGRDTAVVLADCGLNEEGQARAAALCRANSGVTVLLPSQLEEFVT